MRAKWLLFFCSTLLSMLVLEFIFRGIAPPTLTPASFTHTAKAKLYGWAASPSSRTRFRNPDTGISYWFHTNSHGWKDVEHTFAKPEESFRVLIVGDSHTYGIVKLEKVYPRQLENILKEEGYNNVEVISVGVGGWGTDQQLEFLKNEGLKYSPDIVICQFTANDILDNLSPNEETPKDAIYWYKPFRYDLIEGELTKTELKPLTQSIKARLVAFTSETAIVFNLRRMVDGAKIVLTQKKSGDSYYQEKKRSLTGRGSILDPLAKALFCKGGDERIENGWELYTALLSEMKNLVEADGSRFAVFSEAGDDAKLKFYLTIGMFSREQGEDYAFVNGQRKSIDYLAPHKKLTDICHDNGMLLIETKRKYQRYDLDPHANNEGNKAMAMDIADFLKEWEYFREIAKR